MKNRFKTKYYNTNKKIALFKSKIRDMSAVEKMGWNCVNLSLLSSLFSYFWSQFADFMLNVMDLNGIAQCSLTGTWKRNVLFSLGSSLSLIPLFWKSWDKPVTHTPYRFGLFIPHSLTCFDFSHISVNEWFYLVFRRICWTCSITWRMWSFTRRIMTGSWLSFHQKERLYRSGFKHN